MSTEFIRDEDRPYFKSGRPRYIEVESQATLTTADLIAEIERRISKWEDEIKDAEKFGKVYSSRAKISELQSLLTWIKSQLNTTK